MFRLGYQRRFIQGAVIDAADQVGVEFAGVTCSLCVFEIPKHDLGPEGQTLADPEVATL